MKVNEVIRDVGVIDLEKPEIKTEKPPMFNVVLNNDDYVSGEAVAGALQQVFHMSIGQAVQVMMNAHRSGKAIVGTFSKEVAETKADAATSWTEKFQAELGADERISKYLFTVEPAE